MMMKKMVDYVEVGNLIDDRCSPVAATEEILLTTTTCRMGWEGSADWRMKMEVAEVRSPLTAAEAMATMMTCLEVVKSLNCHRCFEKIRKVELVVVKTLNCRCSKMEKAAGLVIVLMMAEAKNAMVEGFRLRVKEG